VRHPGVVLMGASYVDHVDGGFTQVFADLDESGGHAFVRIRRELVQEAVHLGIDRGIEAPDRVAPRWPFIELTAHR
jgi:hypothetical protein